MITFAFTRPADKIPESLRLAESLGLEASAAPSLEILEGESSEYRDAELALTSGKIDIVVFGSGTAVEKCTAGFGTDRFRSLFGGKTLVAIGPYTSKMLKNIGGLSYDIMPVDDYSSYGIVKALRGRVDGKGVMLVRSDSGSEVLKQGLTDDGAIVTDFASYRLREVGMTDDLERIFDGLRDGSIDAIGFTSPMSADSFFSLMEGRFGEDETKRILSERKVAAIGRPTALKLASLGREPDIVPAKTTFEDMLKAVRDSE
jgi:uroporphyrinogen-III synthase